MYVFLNFQNFFSSLKHKYLETIQLLFLITDNESVALVMYISQMYVTSILPCLQFSLPLFEGMQCLYGSPISDASRSLSSAVQTVFIRINNLIALQKLITNYFRPFNFTNKINFFGWKSAGSSIYFSLDIATNSQLFITFY